MGWSEGVLVVALVVVRLYSLVIEQVRAGIAAGRTESDDVRTVNARWLRFLMATSIGAALLLAASALLAASGGGGFSAGMRVGMVLWGTEVLVHVGGLIELVRRLRAGAPVTVEAAFSLPAATWSSTFFAVPLGAFIGSLIGRAG
ncbi:MAG: hypothetical protein JNK05_00130 [Myxococcales bacterium]|jgi:hypothetical protein|nr:hypothetical protein [Myxococcales bacterium]